MFLMARHCTAVFDILQQHNCGHEHWRIKTQIHVACACALKLFLIHGGQCKMHLGHHGCFKTIFGEAVPTTNACNIYLGKCILIFLALYFGKKQTYLANICFCVHIPIFSMSFFVSHQRNNSRDPVFFFPALEQPSNPNACCTHSIVLQCPHRHCRRVGVGCDFFKTPHCVFIKKTRKAHRITIRTEVKK